MKRAFVVAVVALVVATVSGASALWLSRGDGSGTAGADRLAAGTVPTAVVTSRSVAVSWSASAFKDGQAATSYNVSRYAAASGGTPVATLSCATTSCTETEVAPGTWHYSVKPAYAAWTGSESARQSATVGSPTLTLAPSTITTVPATLTGTAANLIAGETVTFRLDSATPLTGTLAGGNIVPASGGGAVSVAIPADTSAGAHTVYLIGSAEGSVPPASAPFTYTPVVAPTLTFTSSTVDNLPKTLSGVTTGFGSDTLTFRLDDPATGTVLASTGTTSVTVTFSACLTAGSHTVYALGSAGRQASATVNVTTVSCVLSLNLQNKTGGSGTAGLVEAGDRVVVGYNQALDLGTVCSGWNSLSMSISVGVTLTKAVGGGNNLLQVSGGSGCTSTFRFADKVGSNSATGIDLGDSRFTDKDVTFTGSTLVWDSTAKTLTLTVGTPCTAGGSCGTRVAVASSTTATYTPAAGLTAGGVAVTGSATRTGTQF